MKSKTQILQEVIQKQRLILTLLVVFIFCFAALVIVLYKNNLSTTTSSSQPSTTIQSLRNFAAISTVNRTYTSKGTVIINNLWKPTYQIASGVNHTCALSNGKVYCWGIGGYGSLGNNTTTNRNSVPVAVKADAPTDALYGKTITQISAGGVSTCALANGQAFCWGDDYYGQLGDNNVYQSQSQIPVAVKADALTDALYGKTVTQIATGDQHTCAVANGQAYCWGNNVSGQLGNGSLTKSNVPVAVKANVPTDALYGRTVTQITSGDDNTCALADGQEYCWGAGIDSIPVAVNTGGGLSGKTITQITAGGSSLCAIADGQAFCWWGGGAPVAVKADAPIDALYGKTITQITAGAGYLHVCALAIGQTYCWGPNTDGQLGDGTTNNSSVPVTVNTSGVLGGKTVTQVAPGFSHTCAIGNGRVYCWGYNWFGQLGDGTTINKYLPVRVNDSYY